MIKYKLSTSYKDLVLASSSETRIKLLKKYTKNFVVCPHKIDENQIKKMNEPEKVVYELAKQKAFSIQHNFPDSIIIGSDQILVCDQKILNKPNTLQEAKRNLLFLRNKKHMLLSSIFIIHKAKHLYSKTTKAVL